MSTSPYVSIGGAVFDERDGLVHLVVDVATITCLVACQAAQVNYVRGNISDRWCRVATNYLEENPGNEAPRWMVFVPVNCMECLACLTDT